MDEDGGAVTVINPFEVPAEADGTFIAAWEPARDFLKGRDGLHRHGAASSARPRRRRVRPHSGRKSSGTSEKRSELTRRESARQQPFSGQSAGG